jgi:Leucine-rich repeat (LRR) protein
MRNLTSIKSHDFFFESLKNLKITGLSFEGNKKIIFLPVNLYENFPNLFGIDASDCAVRQISNKNFQRLNRLKMIWLRGNEIEIISSSTFEDLKELEYLSLGTKFNFDSSFYLI